MGERNSHDWQETTTIWHRITGEAGVQLPDTDATVQVYDSELEDVVFATAELNEETGRVAWVDINLDQPLPSPAWWAEIAFPEDI
jgi:hypothetical protein